jgi:putative DNA primase/helicase
MPPTKTKPAPGRARVAKSKKQKAQADNNAAALAAQVCAWLNSLGYAAPRKLIPGKWTPIPAKGKARGNRSARVIYHTDTRLAYVHDWATGAQFTKKFNGAKVKIPPVEKRTKADRAAQADRADDLRRIAQITELATTHEYLTRKKIAGHGALIGSGFSKLILYVPMLDPCTLEIKNYQRIAPNGCKRFLPGPLEKNLIFPIGRMLKNPEVICIVEGFATAASIYECCFRYFPCVVAFSADALPGVALAMRKKYPHALLIICADDDHKTPGNPGVERARAAASLANGTVAIPNFKGVKRRTKKHTDFNDVHVYLGKTAVRKQINAAIKTARLRK